MAKKDNKILWIVGLLIVGIILYNSNPKLFAMYSPKVPSPTLSNIVNNYYYPSVGISDTWACQKNNVLSIQSSFNFKQKTLPSAKECIKVDNVYYISKTLKPNLKGNCMNLGELMMIDKESVFNNLYFTKSGKGYSFCINRGTIKNPKYSVRNFVQSSSCPKGYKVLKYTKSFSNDIQDEGKYTCSGNNIILKYCENFPNKIVENCELGCEQKNYNLDGKDILITKCKGDYKPNQAICSSDSKEFFKTDTKGTLNFDKCTTCINKVCTPIFKECDNDGCSVKTNSEYRCIGNLRNFINSCLYGCSGDGDGFSCKSDCNEVIKLFGITIPDNTQCLRVDNNERVVKGYDNYIIYNDNIHLNIYKYNVKLGEDIYSTAVGGLSNFKFSMKILGVYFTKVPAFKNAYNNMKIYIDYQSNQRQGPYCFTDSAGYIYSPLIGCTIHELTHNYLAYYVYTTSLAVASLPSCNFEQGGYIPLCYWNEHEDGSISQDCTELAYSGLAGSHSFSHEFLGRLINFNVPWIVGKCNLNITDCTSAFVYTQNYPNQAELVSCMLIKIKNNPVMREESSTSSCGPYCSATWHYAVVDYPLLAKYAWECGARTDKDVELHKVCPSYGV